MFVAYFVSVDYDSNEYYGSNLIGVYDTIADVEDAIDYTLNEDDHPRRNEWTFRDFNGVYFVYRVDR